MCCLSSHDSLDCRLRTVEDNMQYVISTAASADDNMSDQKHVNYVWRRQRRKGLFREFNPGDDDNMTVLDDR